MKVKEDVAKESLTMSDSDEEMNLELLDAIRIHKEKKTDSNSMRNTEIEVFIQTDTKIENTKRCSRIDYEKQGAIPKKKFAAKKKNEKVKNTNVGESSAHLSGDPKPEQILPQYGKNNLEVSLNDFNIKPETRYNEERVNQVLATKDFFNHVLDSLNVKRLPDNIFNYEVLPEYSCLNIKPECSQSNFFASRGTMILLEQMIKSALVLKVLERMSNTGIFNYFMNFFFGEKIYEKNINSLLTQNIEYSILDESLLPVLFPQSDVEYLEKKLEECEEDWNLIERFVEKEYQRLTELPEQPEIHEDFAMLLSELPNHDIKILYRVWLKLINDKEKIENFIKMEKEIEKVKSIQAALLIDLPDLEEETSMMVAQDYLNDEEGLKLFIESEKLSRKMMRMLEKMKSALPEANPIELQNICEKLKGDEGFIDTYIENAKKEYKLQNQVLELQSLFPDADPQFLRQEIEADKDNPDIIQYITEDLLDGKNYPKITKNTISEEKKELWQFYVDHFTIKNYLYKVPNPEEFENDADDNPENNLNLVFDFLQKRYPFFLRENFQDIFDLNKGNIVKTCEIIEEECEPVQLACSGFRDGDYDELFLKKAVYIDKRKEITSYLAQRRSEKESGILEAEINDSYLECPVCFSTKLVPSDAVTCPDGHIFCQSCIIRFINISLGEGVCKFPCLIPDCGMNFSHLTLENILPDCTYFKIIRKEQIEELKEAEVDGLEFCPFCDFAYIPHESDVLFRCRNSECLIESCRKCRNKTHIPLRCEEIERSQDIEARKKIEESMTNKLCRECPSCRKKFIRIDGCNLISCICNAKSCYICRSIVDGYNHFRENNESSGCPLYTDNEILHERDVHTEGTLMRDTILKENPDVRILNDPTADFY